MQTPYTPGSFCQHNGTTFLVEHANAKEEGGPVMYTLNNPLTGKSLMLNADTTSPEPFTVPMPSYPMGGKTAALRVRQALAQAGLKRASCLNGENLAGWIPANHFGATGFSVKVNPDNPQQVIWHVVVSGKPHLQYEEEEENQGTYDDPDYITLHHPVKPNALNGVIKKALTETLGLDVVKVRYSGHQTNWDDDVEYDVITARPDWLVNANT